MSYPYPPYMQAAPPPGYGAPGSTGYFTTQNLGGFYAPISNNPPFATAGQPQPQMLGTPGSGGQLFNNWPGSREEQEKMQKQQKAEEVKKQETQKQRGSERGERGGDRSHSRASHRSRNDRPNSNHKSKTTHKKGRSAPWEEVVERLGDFSIKEEGDEDDDTTLYDHCENSSDGSGSPRASNSPTGSNIGPVGTSIDDQEVVIQAGGSARVIVHLLRPDEAPYNTTFIVSARRMMSLARGWPHVCHQGTNDLEITSMDESAVLGMYWLLQVLHMSVEEQQFYQGNDPSSCNSPDFNSHRLRPGMAPATTPRNLPPTIPSELPARVLAYATMYANQIGVLEPTDNNKQQMLGNGPAGPQSSPVSPPADRFRTRAENWMSAVTSNPRCRRTLDSSLVAPAEWPFVLYTARVLGDRQLFSIVLRTLLERWWVNERGIFCDINGPARIDKLPDAMREVVMKDLTPFKVSRERAVETIINSAMTAFSC